MRIPKISLCLLLLLPSCDTAESASPFATLAREFFAAASVGDSVHLANIVADSLVYRDLRIIASEEPEMIRYAAQGLRVQSGGHVSQDSAYLFFKPTRGGHSRGLDLGLVRRGSAWQVYYAGLTGPDLRQRARKSGSQ
jgi:hypothetical protein